MCNYTCFCEPLPWKVMFLVTSKPTAPTVFNQQASDLVHCKEETGAHAKKYLGIPILFFLQILKLFILPPKNTWISKNSIKFIILFFFIKKLFQHTYICTKCNENFKFSISKILWGVVFCLNAPKRRFIFYNSFCLWLTENLHKQKHFLERNIFL